MLARTAAELLRVVAVAGAYAAILLVAWTAALGAARLVAAARPEETRRNQEFLRGSPGRCLLSGLGHCLVAGILARILGAVNGLLGILFLLWWLRSVLRGMVAWWMLRGGEIHAWRAGTAGTEAESLDEGLRASAMASVLPVLGWIFVAFVALQGLGAETLTMLGRRPEGAAEEDDGER